MEVNKPPKIQWKQIEKLVHLVEAAKNPSVKAQTHTSENYSDEQATLRTEQGLWSWHFKFMANKLIEHKISIELGIENDNRIQFILQISL